MNEWEQQEAQNAAQVLIAQRRSKTQMNDNETAKWLYILFSIAGGFCLGCVCMSACVADYVTRTPGAVIIRQYPMFARCFPVLLENPDISAVAILAIGFFTAIFFALSEAMRNDR